MSWRRTPKLNPCPGCGAELSGLACPKCGAAVLPDGSVISNATFRGNVYFRGDGVINTGHFEFTNVKRGEIYSAGALSVSSSHFQVNAPITVRGGPGQRIPLVTPEEPLEENPGLQLTFGTEVLVAWRFWGVQQFRTRDGFIEPRLRPLAARDWWEPRRRKEAICIASGDHDAPYAPCTCGIWAIRDKKTLLDAVDSAVFGEVYLWGRVIEFEDGYRAQYAYPKSLYPSDVSRENLEALGRIYGAAVIA